MALVIVTFSEPEERFRKTNRNSSRGTWDIMARILTISSEEIRSKYQIMRLANLNSKGVEKYLDILFSSELLAQPGVEYFRASEKGLEFLKYYGIIKSIMGELEMTKSISPNRTN